LDLSARRIPVAGHHTRREPACGMSRNFHFGFSADQ
jgi:hypothetical protein